MRVFLDLCSIILIITRLRMKFLVVALLVGAASSFKISSKEDLIKRFGENNVSFHPNPR